MLGVDHADTCDIALKKERDVFHSKTDTVEVEENGIFTIFERKYMGYKSLSAFECKEGKLETYAFKIEAPNYSEAMEIYKQLLISVRHKYGEPIKDSMAPAEREKFISLKPKQEISHWKVSNKTLYTSLNDLGGVWEVMWHW